MAASSLVWPWEDSSRPLDMTGLFELGREVIYLHVALTLK